MDLSNHKKVSLSGLFAILIVIIKTACAGRGYVYPITSSFGGGK